jgi:hypothetical protein
MPVLFSVLTPLAPSRLLALLMLVLLGGGCDLVERPPIQRDFGAPYEILFNVPAAEVIPGARGITPLIEEQRGSIVAVVRYLGGCAPHTFRLDYTLEGDQALIWFIHASNADECAGDVIHVIQEPLPFEVLAKATIVLLEPSSNETELRPERSEASL